MTQATLMRPPHASVGSPISSDTFPRSFDCVINLQVAGGKNRFMEKMFAGEYKTQHVLVFNAGESEMCREFEYHSTGLWFASYTEVTGAFTMDRFTPAAENVHVVSYPYIWLQDQLIRHGSNKEQFTHSVFQEIFSVGAPRVLFTYMMRQPKPHRRMMWDLLEKENLVNEFCTNAEKGICLDLKDNKMKDSDVLDNTVYADGVQHQSHRFPPWYFDCLIDFIPETHTSQMFFTEKTWRAFLGMRVPIIIGAQNCMKSLTAIGFQFPSYIKWDEWDNKQHEYDRIKGAISVLKELGQEQVADLWRLSRPERKHNFQLALCLAGKYHPPFQGEGFEDYTHVYDFAKGIADHAKENLDFS